MGPSPAELRGGRRLVPRRPSCWNRIRAGLPGIVLAMLLPDGAVILLEPMPGGWSFSTSASPASGLPNVTVRRGRAEEVRGQVHADVSPRGRSPHWTGWPGWRCRCVRPGGMVLALRGSAQRRRPMQARPVLRGWGSGRCGAAGQVSSDSRPPRWSGSSPATDRRAVTPREHGRGRRARPGAGSAETGFGWLGPIGRGSSTRAHWRPMDAPVGWGVWVARVLPPGAGDRCGVAGRVGGACQGAWAAVSGRTGRERRSAWVAGRCRSWARRLPEGAGNQNSRPGRTVRVAERQLTVGRRRPGGRPAMFGCGSPAPSRPADATASASPVAADGDREERGWLHRGVWDGPRTPASGARRLRLVIPLPAPVPPYAHLLRRLAWSSC